MLGRCYGSHCLCIAQVAGLVASIAVSVHDRAAYSTALQPVLAACDAKLDGFARLREEAFKHAVETLAAMAKPGVLGCVRNRAGAGHNRECQPVLPDLRRPAAKRCHGAAATLHVLLAVSACAGSCDAELAVALSEILSSARTNSVLAGACRQCLGANLAEVCAGTSQCQCKQTVSASLLTASLQLSAAGGGSRPQCLRLNHFVDVAQTHEGSGYAVAALIDMRTLTTLHVPPASDRQV
jgi:hypothetical protein